MRRDKKRKKSFYNDSKEPEEAREEVPVEVREEALAHEIKAPAEMSESFAAMFASPVIRVIVGSAKKEYNLHEGVLVRTTPYFASLLRSGLEEAQSRSVELSTEVDREDAFEKYIHYIYQQDYTVKGDVEDLCILHARVYALAERLCVDKLKQLSAQKLQHLLSNRYKHPEFQYGGFGSTIRTTPQPLISTDVLVQLASIIYNHTPDVSQEPGGNITKSEKTKNFHLHAAEKIPPEDSTSGSSAESGSSVTGRHIVSCFAASCWSLFRSDRKLKRFMEENTDFAYDVLFKAGDGEPLKSPY